MGELEARVMAVLWDNGGWMTPGEVNDVLARDRDLAYTTVMTILVRLHEKVLVDRERRGRAWAYRPVQEREEHAADRMTKVLRAGGDLSLALARFVDGMTAKERAQLRRLLERRRGTR